MAELLQGSSAFLAGGVALVLRRFVIANVDVKEKTLEFERMLLLTFFLGKRSAREIAVVSVLIEGRRTLEEFRNASCETLTDDAVFDVDQAVEAGGRQRDF